MHLASKKGAFALKLAFTVFEMVLLAITLSSAVRLNIEARSAVAAVEIVIAYLPDQMKGDSGKLLPAGTVRAAERSATARKTPLESQKVLQIDFALSSNVMDTITGS